MEIIVESVRGTSFAKFLEECEILLGGKISRPEEWDFAFSEGMSAQEAVQTYWTISLSRLPQTQVQDFVFTFED